MKRTYGTIAIAVALVLVTPSAALAQETETDRGATVAAQEDRSAAIEQAKRRALEAIDRRLETLERLGDAVASNGHITDEHARTLAEDYTAASRRLRALADEIEAAETPAEVLRLATKIVVDYRIYLVVAPKTHEVIVSDTIVGIAGRFASTAEELEAAIGRAGEAGYDVTEADRWLVVAEDEIAEATRTGGPVADTVIDLDAADWPDPAQELLRAGAADLRDARLDLREAAAALHRSAQALRQAIGR